MAVEVAQLLRDYEDPTQVNQQLDRLGYQIGIRLIDELLARVPLIRCSDFKETAEIIRLAFRLFLNLTPVVNAGEKEFTVSLGSETGDGCRMGRVARVCGQGRFALCNCALWGN